MAFIVTIIGILLLGLAGFFVVIRIIQMLSLIALIVVAVCLAAIIYISLAVGGITLAVLFQLLGPTYGGWIVAAAIAVALLTGWQILKAVIREVMDLPRKCGLRNASKPNSTAALS